MISKELYVSHEFDQVHMWIKYIVLLFFFFIIFWLATFFHFDIGSGIPLFLHQVPHAFQIPMYQTLLLSIENLFLGIDCKCVARQSILVLLSSCQRFIITIWCQASMRTAAHMHNYDKETSCLGNICIANRSIADQTKSNSITNGKESSNRLEFQL